MSELIPSNSVIDGTASGVIRLLSTSVAIQAISIAEESMNPSIKKNKNE